MWLSRSRDKSADWGRRVPPGERSPTTLLIRRRFQCRRCEINHHPNGRQHSSSRCEDEMHDAIDAAPLRQYTHKRTRGKRVSTLRGRQQYNSSSLACCRDQKVEAARRKARLNHHGTGVPVLRRQKPGVAALLLLMEDGELAKVSWCRGLPLLGQEGRTCYKNPPA
jgi:hypothetical protein